MNTSEPGNSVRVFNIKNFISLADLHSFLEYAKMETVFPLCDQHHRKFAKQNNTERNLSLEFQQQLSIIKNLNECLLCGASAGRLGYEKNIVQILTSCSSNITIESQNLKESHYTIEDYVGIQPPVMNHLCNTSQVT